MRSSGFLKRGLQQALYGLPTLLDRPALDAPGDGVSGGGGAARSDEGNSGPAFKIASGDRDDGGRRSGGGGINMIEW
jgi:hypothetical protein